MAVAPLNYNLTGPVGVSTPALGATLYQGSTLTYSMVYNADLTGYGAHLNLVTPGAEQLTPLITLTLGSGIVITPNSPTSGVSTIAWTFSATQLANIPLTFSTSTSGLNAAASTFLNATGYYDLILDPGNVVGASSVVAYYGNWAMLAEASTASVNPTQFANGVHLVSNADYAVLETSGYVYVGFSGLTGTHTGTMPASPIVGMRVAFADEDGSLATKTWSVAGSGHSVVLGAAPASSVNLNATLPGPFGSIEFLFNGAIWKAI